MAALHRRAVSLLTILLIFYSVSAVHEPNIPDILKAIERILHFYKSNLQNIIIDGVFGLRILEGQLALIIEEHANGKVRNLKHDVIKTISMLHKEAALNAELSLRNIRKSNPDVISDFGYIVSKPWKVWKPYRKLDMSKKWSKHRPYKKQFVINEKFSDNCMKELLSARCETSSRCLKVMVAQKYTSGYGITHQLLYTELAEEVGCLPKIERWLIANNHPDGVVALHHELCANILNSMQEKFTKADYRITKSYQDLFMEEQVICATEGFTRDFLHPQLLKEILSWQHSSGCYGENVKHISHYKKPVIHIKTDKSSKKSKVIKSKSTYSPYEVLHIAQPPKPPSEVNFSDTGSVLLNKKDLKLLNDRLYHASQINNQNYVQDKFVQRQDMNNEINEDNDFEDADRNLVNPHVPAKVDSLKDQVQDKNTNFKSRSLFNTLVLSDECEVHNTAVAAGVLAVYLHYYFENLGSSVLEPTISISSMNDRSDTKQKPVASFLNNQKFAIGRNTSQAYDYDAGDNEHHESPDQMNDKDYTDPDDDDDDDDDADVDADGDAVYDAEGNGDTTSVDRISSVNPRLQKKIVIGPDMMERSHHDDGDKDYDNYDYEKEDGNDLVKNDNHDIHLDDSRHTQGFGNPSSFSSRDTRKISLPYTQLVFIAAIMLLMILFMYRFIKKRRVSLRYKGYTRT